MRILKGLLAVVIIMGFQSGFTLQAETKKGSDLLFDHNYLHHIEISIKKSEWNRFIRELEDDEKSGRYFKANFRYSGAAGVIEMDEVGFRIRGNTTRRIPYNRDMGTYHAAHFKIKFDKTFNQKKGTDAYKKRKKRDFFDLEALNLKWSKGDESHMREMYCYDLMNRAGVNAPRTGKTRVTIIIGNKPVYFGLYTIIEPIDKKFLRYRFGKKESRGELYKCLWQRHGPATLEYDRFFKNKIGVKKWQDKYRPSYDLKTKVRDDSKEKLIDFVKNLNELTGDQLREWVEKHLEVDRFLRYLAVNTLVGMPDDYWAMGNNYYLFINRDGRAEFIPYDYDNSLGQGWKPFDTGNVDIYKWHDLVKEFEGKDRPRPLVDAVLSVPEWKKQYRDYLVQFIEPGSGMFEFKDYKARFDRQYKIYSNYLQNDTGEGEIMLNHFLVESYFNEKTLSIVNQLGLKRERYNIGTIMKHDVEEAVELDGRIDEGMVTGFSEETGDVKSGPDAPGSMSASITAGRLHIFVPLSFVTDKSPVVTVYLSNVGNNTVKVDVSKTPDGRALIKDTLWERTAPESDIYYAYYPLVRGVGSEVVSKVQKFYYDNNKKQWGTSSNTRGTYYFFSDSGFEMSIPLKTIHADGASGKVINIGVTLDSDDGIADSIGGPDNKKTNRLYVAQSIAVP
jgi:spore coat protein H